MLEKYWGKTITAEDWAYLYLFQTGKTMEKILNEIKTNPANMSAKCIQEQLDKWGNDFGAKGTRDKIRLDALQEVEENDKLILQREYDAVKYDYVYHSNAIALRTSSGSVGYLPDEVAALLFPALDKGTIVAVAEVIRLYPISSRSDRKGFLNVKIVVSDGSGANKTITENSIVTGMLGALEKFGQEKHFLHAAEYVIENTDNVLAENIQKMYDCFVRHNSQKAADLLRPYLGEELAVDKNDTYAPWRTVYNEHLLDNCIKANKGDEKLFSKIKLANSGEMAPAFIVKCAVVPYLELYSGRPKKIGEYRTDYMNVKIIELADKASVMLNTVDLQNLIETEYRKGGSAWLLPYGRYASREQITALISNMRKWEDWHIYAATGRSNIITARGALMLSETREAMMNIDKKGLLDNYAKLRGTDADTIRDTVLAEFGLDGSGKKEYDLGSKKIIVSLAQDLTLEIYDTAEEKIVKSIPKKGADPERFERVSADYSEMKSNVKKVIKGRNDLLFEGFLSGATRPAKSWIMSYTKNLVLRRVAELIVWNQGKATFILTEEGAVDCNGNPYEISETTNIGVAHPIEMEKTEVESWQKYLTSHGLKQPFAQIWEPAIEKSTVKEDRYEGCMIPFYRFRNQKKHGIIVTDEDFHNYISIRFEDCYNTTVNQIDFHRHEIRNEDNFEVTSFRFVNYTRRVNHIVAYLDKCTMYGRILKDDTSIAVFLDSFTLAQITEFINVAMENKCNNCLAVLLDYKNRKFAAYDPMDEFTLD